MSSILDPEITEITRLYKKMMGRNCKQYEDKMSKIITINGSIYHSFLKELDTKGLLKVFWMYIYPNETVEKIMNTRLEDVTGLNYLENLLKMYRSSFKTPNNELVVFRNKIVNFDQYLHQILVFVAMLVEYVLKNPELSP